ncbi:uncharacterized protein LACBIDRAFT_322069 [Laccaria bicolor S238N-H82]|uniref:Predicted protein n=1 Tax=Laccaria bicolor (strain S238N-H82 / ATCC MYA-4686) TaxID=486041 RepID=B0CS10_LACBS|nr:uncharacterized protein LACBIDRAFT_322069 [Laccaria bicolor S238N-H82]EDR14773.1 predicted protein [Laccaria bicolor S238N-H82]|eukprot:XP_001875332.1 predicted protein [Laccaria bicolor S238N-H82]
MLYKQGPKKRFRVFPFPHLGLPAGAALRCVPRLTLWFRRVPASTLSLRPNPAPQIYCRVRVPPFPQLRHSLAHHKLQPSEVLTRSKLLAFAAAIVFSSNNTQKERALSFATRRFYWKARHDGGRHHLLQMGQFTLAQTYQSTRANFQPNSHANPPLHHPRASSSHSRTPSRSSSEVATKRCQSHNPRRGPGFIPAQAFWRNAELLQHHAKRPMRVLSRIIFSASGSCLFSPIRRDRDDVRLPSASPAPLPSASFGHYCHPIPNRLRMGVSSCSSLRDAVTLPFTRFPPPTQPLGRPPFFRIKRSRTSFDMAGFTFTPLCEI